MSTKAVTYRLEESLLQRIEKAVEVLRKENPYGTISKNSFVAGAIEKATEEILKEESLVKKQIKWSEILSANEEKLVDALETAYRNACDNRPGQSGMMTEAVIINKDGEISNTCETPNTTDGGVWAGNAIYVGGIKWFNPWDNEDYEEVILNSGTLSPNEQNHYVTYMMEKFGEDDWKHEVCPTTLSEWNEEVGEQVYQQLIDDYKDAYACEWAQEQFDRELAERKENEQYKPF